LQVFDFPGRMSLRKAIADRDITLAEITQHEARCRQLLGAVAAPKAASRPRRMQAVRA